MNQGRKDALTFALARVEEMKQAAGYLTTVQHILRDGKQDEPEHVRNAFRIIHDALWQQVGWAYETAFAWALLQPGDIPDKAKALAEERWGKEYRRQMKIMGWEEKGE